MVKKLKELNSKDYKVVFFTNQAGVSTGKASIGSIKEKIENIIKEIGVPIQVFVSPTRSIYRKPAPGMWEALSTQVLFLIITFYSQVFEGAVFQVR